MTTRGYPVTKVIRAKKRAFAEKLKLEHDKLTIQQKLKKLDDRLGEGVGAKKERARLQSQLEAEKQPKPPAKKTSKETEKTQTK